MKKYFNLDPSITHLNHGSFGASPKSVFENYQKWQLELERSPVDWMVNSGPKQLDVSRNALAEYINCDSEDLVFVANPSTAMNIVIRSLDLKEGDEVLTTDQEYGAVERTWKYYCKKAGAIYKRQKISHPLRTKQQFLDEFFSGLTSKTKVVFFSHMTSTTSLLFPAKEICQRAKELGLMTIVDGAHIPGHVPLDISTLDADVYTGANHKWLLSPKGNAFLYVDKKLQKDIDPLVISWGYNPGSNSQNQFQEYLQYNGTKDFSAYLTVPACLAFFKEHDWESKKADCRKMLQHYYPIVAKQLDSTPICTVSDDFLGQICSIPIKTSDPVGLKNHLYFQEKVEIPIMATEHKVYLRISFQGYNEEADIERLIDALKNVKKNTTFLV